MELYLENEVPEEKDVGNTISEDCDKANDKEEGI
jgi:hypothetical protein